MISKAEARQQVIKSCCGREPLPLLFRLFYLLQGKRAENVTRLSDYLYECEHGWIFGAGAWSVYRRLGRKKIEPLMGSGFEIAFNRFTGTMQEMDYEASLLGTENFRRTGDIYSGCELSLSVESRVIDDEAERRRGEKILEKSLKAFADYPRDETKEIIQKVFSLEGAFVDAKCQSDLVLLGTALEQARQLNGAKLFNATNCDQEIAFMRATRAGRAE